MLKFEHLGSKYLKTNFRFEISTFEIIYQQIIVKIKTWYFLRQNGVIRAFGLKIFKKQCQIWNQDLQNRVRTKFHLQIRKLILLCPKTHFGHLGLKFQNQKLVENSRFCQFWNFFSFRTISLFFGGRFSCFWSVLAGSGF